MRRNLISTPPNSGGHKRRLIRSCPPLFGGVGELELLVSEGVYSEFALVDHGVVPSAEQNQVDQVGEAAVEPGQGVVGVELAPIPRTPTLW